MTSNKQKEILRYLATVESATLEQIYENVTFSYYANWKKYIGEIMARLVIDRRVRRIKPGVFALNTPNTFFKTPKLDL
jgi:hypothetical protein